MIREDVLPIITNIENNIKENETRSDVFQKLRQLSFTDFCLLMLSMPNLSYPKLSKKLPKMASIDVQKNWTGSSGIVLLKQSIDFVQTLFFNFSTIRNFDFNTDKVLDYGCGYGRLARLFYYFINEENFYAVDPWDKSIDICKQDGLTKNFFVSDYLPKSLPIENIKFDIIFSFSVFTHLSEKATFAALTTLTKYLSKGGLLVLTIRPIEYWDFNPSNLQKELIDGLKHLHKKYGFAFNPHERDRIEGDITYGDTSIRIEWIIKNFPELDIIKTDYSLNDKFQIYLFLQKKN